MAKPPIVLAIIAVAILAPFHPALYAHAAGPEGVAAQSVAVASAAGNHLKKVRTGSPFVATINLVNSGAGIRDYVSVMEVRDSEGITVALELDNGLLGPGQKVAFSKTLVLREVGNYTVRAFAYSSPAIERGMSMDISPAISTRMSIVDASSARQVGVYVPLYEDPNLEDQGSMWNGLVRAKASHPAVPFVVTINPWSGPGSWQDPAYIKGTSQLRKAGIEYVLGYVSTGYARQDPGYSIVELKAQIDRYREWYPDVNGVMLDEVNSSGGKVSFYKELVSYAKAKGMEYVLANPGTNVDEKYVGVFDSMMIFEDKGLPTVAQLQANTFYPKYPPEYFSFTSRNISSLDPDYVDEIKDYVGMFYVTDGFESAGNDNPYDTLPPYFSDLLALLDESQ
jgi:hypothetical protein